MKILSKLLLLLVFVQLAYADPQIQPIDMQGYQINNLADGIDPKDAVNVSQLTASTITNYALEAGGNLEALALKDFATQTTLAQIKAKTDNIPPLGQALNAASVPVVLTASQLATLTPAATVAVTQSTSPWVVSGTVAVSSVGGTVAVTQSTSPWVVSGSTSITGPVSVTQGTSPWVVSGTAAVTQSGAWSVDVNNAGGASAVNVQDGGNSLTVDAPIGSPVNVQVGDGVNAAAIINLATNDALSVAIVDGSGNQITSFGGGTQYTEDVPAASPPIGTAQVMIRADTPAGVTSTDGDNIVRRGSNYGAAYSHILDSSGNIVSSFGTDPVGLKNIALATINPATEDTLVTLLKPADTLTKVTTVDTITNPISVAGTVAVTQSGTWNINDISGTISLPTNAATETTLTTLLKPADTLTKVTTVDTITNPVSVTGAVTVSGAVAATQSGAWSVDVNNAAGASAVNIQDGGNTITVDGTVGISGTVAVTQSTSPWVISGNVTADTELPTAAALADAASATPTTVTVGSIPLLMNATTVDRQRAVVNGLNSTGTGISAAGLVAQLDDTATGSVTENQFAPVRLSSRRALLIEGVASGTNVNVAQATASSLNAQVVGSIASGSADSGNPVKIGGLATSTDPSSAGTIPGTAVTAGQRTNSFYSLRGGQVEAVHSVRHDLTAINTAYDTNPETNNSATIDAWYWRYATVGMTIQSTGTPTGIQISIQVSEDNSNWFDVKNGALGQWIYDDTYTATARSIAYSFEISARYIRVSVTSTGTTSGSVKFDVSNAFIHLRN